ncbi:MAG: adenylosuccinate lyase [Actinomycetota bacterium]
MIERYSLPEMAAIFSDESRFARYLEIELLATEAQVALGIVPKGDADACRSRAPEVDISLVAEIAECEKITNHDVAAFVDVVQRRIGLPAGAWIHHGLTSTDVVDTAWCWMLRDAAGLIVAALVDLISTVITLARTHRLTVMIGRTHGIHAEPTTFGTKVALWALQLDRDRQRMLSAGQTIAVCKLSGAVGTYSNIDPAVEAHVAESLGLRAVPSTQVVARDRHAEYLWACASLGTTIESIAVELRHLQRTEVAEVREGFKVGQKGSSAMPHKRNPISAETLSGLSRVLRGNLQTGLQNVALWHERDISHSSAERIVLPDSSILAYYVVRRLPRLLRALEVDAARMRQNLETSFGIVFSQPVLLALVDAGKSRDEAYRIVQQDAATAWDNRISFRSILEDDERVKLSSTQLDNAFDVQRSIRHAARTIDALDSIGK